jgi:hypothetical protein
MPPLLVAQFSSSRHLKWTKTGVDADGLAGHEGARWLRNHAIVAGEFFPLRAHCGVTQL